MFDGGIDSQWMWSGGSWRKFLTDDSHCYNFSLMTLMAHSFLFPHQKTNPPCLTNSLRSTLLPCWLLLGVLLLLILHLQWAVILLRILDCLDEHLIHYIALCIGGATGSSGLDAHGLRWLCTFFQETSLPFLVLVARQIATYFVDPDALWPLLNGKLIALDKHLWCAQLELGRFRADL